MRARLRHHVCIADSAVTLRRVGQNRRGIGLSSRSQFLLGNTASIELEAFADEVSIEWSEVITSSVLRERARL